MNANLRNFALWVIIVLLLLALFTLFQNPGQRTTSQDISFSQLLNEVDQGRVRDVLIQGPEIHGTFTDGRSFQTYAPNDPSLIQRLYGKGVSITARPQQNDVPWFVSLLVSWLPFIALIGVWIFLSRQMQGAGGKALGFGKSRAKLLTEAHGRVTFEDVAGVDEAKQDLQEIVEFLRDPGKFQRLGGKIPRGVLLVGPPGTGKTLIARAVAGEANVPFFTISGSDFVEMFVGVGASRVRSRAKPMCRSSRSPVPTSSRCSSASAPRACATCSSRRRRTRRASSSSTKSTRSAVIAAPASAAATTSASRRSTSCSSRWTASSRTKA